MMTAELIKFPLAWLLLKVLFPILCLQVDNGCYIAAEICYVKCRMDEGEKMTITRRWFEKKHGEVRMLPTV